MGHDCAAPRIAPADLDHLDSDIVGAIEQVMAGRPPGLLELILLAGFYRTTSYLVRALDLPLEPGAPRFADYSGPTPVADPSQVTTPTSRP